MRKSGDRIGRYLVEALIGAGTMGEVYEALDTRLGRQVALKLMRKGAEPSANQRLLREAQAAAAFEHPNAVVVHDAGEEGGEMFIAMELVRGRPLPALAGPGGAPLGRRLRWMVDAARALGAAHRAGLVHRDVRPDNLLVRDDGVVKVLDFGIARRAQGGPGGEGGELARMATVTGEGLLVGTPMYWAPEQLLGDDVDARTDQFAWAVTAYELLAGELPWDASDSIALVSQILTSDPPPLGARVGGLPEEVERALGRAMSKQAGDRYATIDEAADEIEPFAEAPVADAVRAAAGRRRMGWLALALVAAALAGALAARALLRAERPPPAPAEVPARSSCGPGPAGAHERAAPRSRRALRAEAPRPGPLTASASAPPGARAP